MQVKFWILSPTNDEKWCDFHFRTNRKVKLILCCQTNNLFLRIYYFLWSEIRNWGINSSCCLFSYSISPNLFLLHSSAPFKTVAAPWRMFVNSRSVVFGSLSCMQLLMLEEWLFLLGCPPWCQPFTLNGDVEQPVGTPSLQNDPWLAKKKCKGKDLTEAWIKSLDEVRTSNLFSDHLNCISNLKCDCVIVVQWC